MNYVGLAFQVTDDILNLTKDMGKGIIAEDLK
jgi:geranylgeranyl pyrophosphate synthase